MVDGMVDFGAGAAGAGAGAGAPSPVFQVKRPGGVVEVRGARWEAMAVGALEVLGPRIVARVAEDQKKGDPLIVVLCLSARGAREMAEDFYGLPRDSLTPHMAAIRRKLDALLGIDAAALEAERALAEEERVLAATAAEAEAQRGRRREASRAGRAREAAVAAKQRAENRVESEAVAGHSGGAGRSGAAAAAGGRAPEVGQDRLRLMMSICKWARIQFPPGKPRTIENAVAVLQKHGLCERSSKKDIKAVRARLQQEREMDGIDAGNIVEGRRAPRTATGGAGANPYSEVCVKSEPEPKPEPGRPERAPLKDHARPVGLDVSSAPAPAVKGGSQDLREGKENGALEAGVPSAPAPRPLAGACADWEDDDDF